MASADELNAALVPFRFWYNHVRPHQHLAGRTPAEVWAGCDRPVGDPRWFTAWDGLLGGDYYAPS
ncbi:MAG: integrase core domain-containing protein [Terriglobales bacterium]